VIGQGVPSDVLVDDHMQVTAPLVRLLKSANAALVWTRIEYRSRHLAHAHELDGRAWWEVTSKVLGDETGLSPDAVDRAVSKLVEGGYLLAEQHSLPMQTMSYSPVIVHSAKSRIGQGDLRDIADSKSRKRGLQTAKSRIAPIAEEAQEAQEEESDADGADAYSIELRQVCDLVADLVRANGHPVGVVGVRWWAAADRMMRLDGFTIEQIEILARWATSDEFWAANIRSLPTLRAKASTLRLQRNRELQGRGRLSTVEHGRNVDQILRDREAAAVDERKAVSA
jgi:hypothetical protein